MTRPGTMSGVAALGTALMILLLAVVPVSAASGWTAPKQVWEGNYAQPAMAIDAHGHAHMAVRGDTGIWYLTNAGGSWKRTRLTTDSSHAGTTTTTYGPAIAIDGSTGAISVAYSVKHDNGGDPCCETVLTYRTLSHAGWSSAHAIPVGCENAPSLVARNGVLAVAAQRTSSTFPQQVWFCTNAGGAWSAQQLPQPHDEMTAYADPSLAIDSHGHPHIAYFRRSSFDDSQVIWYASGATRTGDFSREKVSHEYEAYEALSLALDSHDQPRLAFNAYDGGAFTFYASRDASGWHANRVMSGKFDVALVLDAANQPHIVATDADTYSVWYAHKVAGAWQTSHLDTHGPAAHVSIGAFAGRYSVSYEIDKPGAPTDGPPRVWFTHTTH